MTAGRDEHLPHLGQKHAPKAIQVLLKSILVCTSAFVRLFDWCFCRGPSRVEIAVTWISMLPCCRRETQDKTLQVPFFLLVLGFIAASDGQAPCTSQLHPRG